MSNKIADGFVSKTTAAHALSISRELMEEDLAKSGLDEHDLQAEPLPAAPLGLKHPDWWLGGYKIPYFSPTGEKLEAMYRIRVFYKPEIPKDQLKAEGVGKYTQPAGEFLMRAGLPRIVPYLYPNYAEQTGGTLFICEGEKKAAKVAETFKCRAIGIGGKDMWHEWTERGRSQAKALNSWIRDALDMAKPDTVVLLTDPDIERADVMSSYSGLFLRLQAHLGDGRVRMINPGYKIDDYLAAEGEDMELVDLLAMEDVPEADLMLSRDDLITQYGLVPRWASVQGEMRISGIETNNVNIDKLLDQFPRFKGALQYNEDQGRVEVWGEEFKEGKHDHQILCFFQEHLHMPKVGRKMVLETIRGVAHKHTYSAAREDILAAGRWDGNDHISRVFSFLDDNSLAAMRALICGYVKRVMHPGCDWRLMVTLHGPQKVGKSGTMGWLVGDTLGSKTGRLFTMSGAQLDGRDKDVVRRMMSPGIVLLDDVDTLHRDQHGRLKALITQQSEVQRRAYGSVDETFVRRGIMAGTTNRAKFLPNDKSGNTRFAVVEVKAMMPFNEMYERRAAVIAQAWAMVEDGYEPDDIDFESADSHMATDDMEEDFLEFLEGIKDGVQKIDNVWVFKHPSDGRVAFKADAFWHRRGGGTRRGWERDNLREIAEKHGFAWHGKDNKIRFGKDVFLKNVFVGYMGLSLIHI